MVARFQGFTGNIKLLLEAGIAEHLGELPGAMSVLGADGFTGILAGGKRIRGSLVCLVAAALGGALANALPRAVAVELIHAATLIHDDFVDQHRLRRNRPSLWTLAGARRAVLLGDVIFASAIHMMSELGREDGLIVSRVIAEVSRGAYQEPLEPSSLLKLIETDTFDAAIYERIIHLKTAVLFGSACQLGAVAARADDRLQQAWQRYGLRIGEAYQIADDLHEVERCLASRFVVGGEMVSLAPALLFFVNDSKPCVLGTLRAGAAVLTGDLLHYLAAAAKVMKAEIDRRLQSALAAIEQDLPDNDYTLLAQRTPHDIIRMFGEETSGVSSP